MRDLGIKVWVLCLLLVVEAFAVEQKVDPSLLPAPYNTLEKVLPFNPFGWYQHEFIMEAMISSRHVKTVVEIGSLLGKSTRHIASCLPPGGKVYAVDHWEGSEELMEGSLAEAIGVPINQWYDVFLSNVIHAGLVDKIIPVKQKSLDAAKTLDVKADLIFIDGAHDTVSVYQDLEAWAQHLNPGGVIIGDDWTWDSVRAAAIAFAANHPEFKLYNNQYNGYWLVPAN